MKYDMLLKVQDYEPTLFILLIVILVAEVSRLRLCKMRVVQYYVKIKHYLGHEIMVNKNEVLSYCEALRHM